MEIRFFKWKKIIWLGIYNIDIEVVVVYDVGVFYINKKIKFNFLEFNGIFFLLFLKLRFDVFGYFEEIKMFV